MAAATQKLESGEPELNSFLVSFCSVWVFNKEYGFLSNQNLRFKWKWDIETPLRKHPNTPIFLNVPGSQGKRNLSGVALFKAFVLCHPDSHAQEKGSSQHPGSTVPHQCLPQDTKPPKIHCIFWHLKMSAPSVERGNSFATSSRFLPDRDQISTKGTRSMWDLADFKGPGRRTVSNKGLSSYLLHNLLISTETLGAARLKPISSLRLRTSAGT